MSTLADILETYTLEELFELNDLTAEDVLLYLMDEGKIVIPDYQPLDFND